MKPESAAADPLGVARALVTANSYATLATVSADGVPWASPVWMASRDLVEFVWASKPGARHSRNLADTRRMSLVIFDSSAAPGEGSALYVEAEGELVSDEGLRDALAIYNSVSLARGLTLWTAAQLTAPARHRLYRAVAREVFVLDDHDERIRVR